MFFCGIFAFALVFQLVIFSYHINIFHIGFNICVDCVLNLIEYFFIQNSLHSFARHVFLFTLFSEDVKFDFVNINKYDTCIQVAVRHAFGPVDAVEGILVHLTVVDHARLVVEHHLFRQIGVHGLVDLLRTVGEHFVFNLVHVHLFLLQRFGFTLFVLRFVSKLVPQPPELDSTSAFHRFECLRKHVLDLIGNFKHYVSEPVVDFGAGVLQVAELQPELQLLVSEYFGHDHALDFIEQLFYDVNFELFDVVVHETVSDVVCACILLYIQCGFKFIQYILRVELFRVLASLHFFD